MELQFSADLKTLLNENIVLKVKNFQQIVAECVIPMKKYFCFDPRIRFKEQLYYEGKPAGIAEGDVRA